VSSRALVNGDVDASAEPRAQTGYPTTTGGGVMMSGDSCQRMGDPRLIRHEHTTHDWASAVASSTPGVTNNRFAVLPATTDDDDDDDNNDISLRNEYNENSYTEVRHRGSSKRRRPNYSMQPHQQQQQAGSANHQLQSQTPQQIQAGQRRGRGRVMLTGKCGSRDQRFVAAKKTVN